MKTKFRYAIIKGALWRFPQDEFIEMLDAIADGDHVQPDEYHGTKCADPDQIINLDSSDRDDIQDRLRDELHCCGDECRSNGCSYRF